MTLSKIRLIITLTVIGLLFLALNIHIPTGIKYMDSYANTTDVIGEYQYYNINAFYGAGDTTYKRYDASGGVAEANVPLVSMMTSQYSTEGWFVDQVSIDNFRIDIFSDIIGLLLLVFVCASMIKYENKMFSLALITSSTSIIIKIVISALPFIFNGLLLCNLALGVGIAYLIARIFTIFFLLKGFSNLLVDSCCREERFWLNTLWYLSGVIMSFMMVFRWLDLRILYIIFDCFAVLAIAVVGYLLKRTRDFIIRNCNNTSEE